MSRFSSAVEKHKFFLSRGTLLKTKDPTVGTHLMYRFTDQEQMTISGISILVAEKVRGLFTCFKTRNADARKTGCILNEKFSPDMINAVQRNLRKAHTRFVF